MECWMTRTLFGCAPADEESQKALNRHNIGSTFPVDIKVRANRSGAWNRRYHLLCQMIANNIERIEIEPGAFMEVRSKEDVHCAFKYMTGLFDSIVTREGIIRLVKSTAFDKMSADDFANYWRRVLDVIHQKILPGIAIASIEEELARMAS